MRELNQYIKKDVSREIRIKTAALTRDFTLKTEVLEYESSVEVFNNMDRLREPDKIGITLYYPNKNAPTHISTGIYDISVGTVEFGRLIKELENQLKEKVH